MALDTTVLRESRDLRLLIGGEFAAGVGTQAVMVALPVQVFLLTRSALDVGLVGAVELVPLVSVALLGGAIADRMDRRRLLLAAQVVVVLAAGALAAGAFLGHPPLALVYVLAGVLAGASGAQNAASTAMVPSIAGARMRSALSFSFGSNQLTQVIGPGLGGVVIAVFGLGWAYAIDVATCLPLVAAALAMSPQRPAGVGEGSTPPLGLFRSIGEGLRFTMGERALLGSFAIDLLAMTFGMPRALFAVLSLTVYHSGAAGTGLLYASVAVGATLAALTTGWLEHVRRLGRVVIVAVLLWGAFIALAGAARSLPFAAVLLACAGAADSVSAVCRSTINQMVTTDVMRARMSSVFIVVVTSGPRLGDIESGTIASLVSATFSVISGGLACVLGVGAIVLAFPELASFDTARHDLGEASAPDAAVVTAV
jgi:MFS family permease